MQHSSDTYLNVYNMDPSPPGKLYVPKEQMEGRRKAGCRPNMQSQAEWRLSEKSENFSLGGNSHSMATVSLMGHFIPFNTFVSFFGFYSIIEFLAD